MDKKFKFKRYSGEDKVFIISPNLCKSCGFCLEKCPTDVIGWSKEDLGIYGAPMAAALQMENCIACRKCQMVCPDSAILIEKC